MHTVQTDHESACCMDADRVMARGGMELPFLGTLLRYTACAGEVCVGQEAGAAPFSCKAYLFDGIRSHRVGVLL